MCVHIRGRYTLLVIGATKICFFDILICSLLFTRVLFTWKFVNKVKLSCVFPHRTSELLQRYIKQM